MGKMTQYECELKILDLLNQIKNTYREYNPAAGFISASINGDHIMISDCFFTEDNGKREIIQDANGFMFHTVDAVQYEDGRIRVAGRGCSNE